MITDLLAQIEDQLAQVPAFVWAGTLIGLFLLALVALPIARRYVRKAGERHARRHDTDPADEAKRAEDARDRRLFYAAITPAALFWGAVLLGSFRGLVTFGRDTLAWHEGWEYLVPFTLDGVSIAFAVLAIRALKRERSPDRAYRVVWMSTLASSAINFVHEVGRDGGRLEGGAYLALLSVIGMLMFHEFMDQFEQGAEIVIRRSRPKWGIRWLTWFTNTAAATLAWINHPPAEGTDATQPAALKHLEEVRARKAARRAAARPVSRWRPLARAAQLSALLTKLEQRAAEQITALRAEHAAERAEQAAVAQAEQSRAEVAEHSAERLRIALAEQVEQMRSEHAERLRIVEAEHADRLAAALAEQERSIRLERPAPASNVTPIRSAAAGGRRSGAAAPKATSSAGGDIGALMTMFAEHPESGYEWTDREVNRITGAGFSSRAPRLRELASEHLGRCGAERHVDCYRSGAEQITPRETGAAPAGGSEQRNGSDRSTDDDSKEEVA